jgi:hypothetical protein
MPRPLFTPAKQPVPGWAPGLVWTGVENLAPTWVHPRTIQPVASCYTDYATWPTCVCLGLLIIMYLETCLSITSQTSFCHVSVDMVRRVEFLFQRRGKSLTILSVTSLSFGEFAGQNSILVYDQLP